jgi:hypothetical protein
MVHSSVTTFGVHPQETYSPGPEIPWWRGWNVAAPLEEVQA